ncbi:MAG: hypothetical protein LBL19_06610 [Spirochaetaceae bacterium]|nr:hypothetical protein [Spirochaetaceae bacterium]
MVNITVIGAGYVGSTSGACLADFGNHVICVDTDAEKTAMLQKGILPICRKQEHRTHRRGTHGRGMDTGGTGKTRQSRQNVHSGQSR